jgi:predicted membrane channel-forming protein YqfA (hemolysin III family)
MKNSKRFALSDYDWRKWITNVIAFLAPLGVIYFGAIGFLLQTPNHSFAVIDLIPSNFTWGAMCLYLVNALYDLSRKFVSGK